MSLSVDLPCDVWGIVFSFVCDDECGHALRLVSRDMKNTVDA